MAAARPAAAGSARRTGAKGWATYFVRRGYAVYVVDQVARGRSPYIADVYGPARTQTREYAMQRFSTTEKYNIWPQAKLHTQSPGTGDAGDPAFDNYFVSNVPSMEDRGMQARMTSRRLLRCSIASDHRSCSCIRSPVSTGGRSRRRVRGSSRQSSLPSHRGRRCTTWSCRAWGASARRLVAVGERPILYLAAEASFYAPYNHRTVAYLGQAGIKVDYVQLAEIGLRGNGHMMMMEKNSDAIAQVIVDWLDKNAPAPAGFAR
jgi:hypothetical protein